MPEVAQGNGGRSAYLGTGWTVLCYNSVLLDSQHDAAVFQGPVSDPCLPATVVIHLLFRIKRDLRHPIQIPILHEVEAQRRGRTCPVGVKCGTQAQASWLQAPLYCIWIFELIWSNTSFIVEQTGAQWGTLTSSRVLGTRTRPRFLLPMFFTNVKWKCYLPHFCAGWGHPAHVTDNIIWLLLWIPQAFCSENWSHVDYYLIAKYSPIKTDKLDSLGHPEVLIKRQHLGGEFQLEVEMTGKSKCTYVGDSCLPINGVDLRIHSRASSTLKAQRWELYKHPYHESCCNITHLWVFCKNYSIAKILQAKFYHPLS